MSHCDRRASPLSTFLIFKRSEFERVCCRGNCRRTSGASRDLLPVPRPVCLPDALGLQYRHSNSILTSSSPSRAPSRAEDSFCKTAMSRREDIVSCIDVTIMDRSAHGALPSPNGARSRAGHPYSIPKSQPTTLLQTSRNASPGKHAALRASLSLAGLKASVSRGEIG
jgi:hypothetical protein